MTDQNIMEKIKKIQETLNHKKELDLSQFDELEEEKIGQVRNVDNRGNPKEDLKKIIIFIISLAFLKLLAILF